LDERENLMNVQMMTPQQIRVAGFAALARERSPAGMIRLMQQFEMGRGGYSKDRHQWLTNILWRISPRWVERKKGHIRPAKRRNE
jgi:hypothetical protein